MGETPASPLGGKLSPDSLKEAKDVPTLINMLVQILEQMDSRITHIEERLSETSARLTRIEGMLADQSERMDRIVQAQGELRKHVARLDKKVGSIDLSLGALTEASLVQFYREALEREGYRIVEWKRNLRVNDEDIDLYAVVEKQGERTVIVGEVKVKPRHSDVGALLAKAELVEAKRGVTVGKRVLLGVYVGLEVSVYALENGVEVVVF